MRGKSLLGVAHVLAGLAKARCLPLLMSLPMLLATFPSHAAAPGEDADLKAARAAIQARVEQLSNLLASYELTTRYPQGEVVSEQANGRGSIRMGGTRVEQKSLELLGELSGYESMLVPEKSQGQSELTLSMQWHSIVKFHKDRTESLRLFPPQTRKGAMGTISGPSPLPEADLELALGLRGVHSTARLDAGMLSKMKLQRVDAQHVKLVAEEGRTQDEWVLDSTAGYAPVSYRRVFDRENDQADVELTVDKLASYNGLMLPQSATLTQKSWYGGQATTGATITLVVTEYRLNDPQNTPDRYEMKWPAGAEVRDVRKSGRRGAEKSGDGQPAQSGRDKWPKG